MQSVITHPSPLPIRMGRGDKGRKIRVRRENHLGTLIFRIGSTEMCASDAKMSNYVFLMVNVV